MIDLDTGGSRGLLDLYADDEVSIPARAFKATIKNCQWMINSKNYLIDTIIKGKQIDNDGKSTISGRNSPGPYADTNSQKR